MSPPRKPSPPWSRPMLGTDLFIVAEREGEHTPQPCSKADVYPVAKRSRFRGMALGGSVGSCDRWRRARLLDSAFLMRGHKVLYSKRYSPCFSFGECYTAVLHRHRLAVWDHTDFEGFFRYQKSVAERVSASIYGHLVDISPFSSGLTSMHPTIHPTLEEHGKPAD